MQILNSAGSRLILISILALNLPAAARQAATQAPPPVTPNDATVDPEADRLRGSVIKFKCKLEPRSPTRPWKLEPVRNIGGSGVVIAPGRVLTNAHVVHEASEVLLETDKTPLPVLGKVIAVDLGRDLAVIEVDDADFNAAHPAVEMLSGLPKDGCRVTVMGFPLGGESMSTTSGVVSRSEWSDVGHHNEAGMRVQIDAAVNFGNSGGPAFVDGKLAGLVFSGMDKMMTDNISYLIATEEIGRMLTEVKSGRIDGNCVLHAETQTLENPALRQKLGIAAGTSGVVVIGNKDGPLQPWDIITKANGMAIDNKGQVTIEGGRKVDMACAFGRFDRSKDGLTIPVEVIRAGQTMTVDVPAIGERDGVIRSRPNGDYPYLVCGPLAFGPLHQDLLRSDDFDGQRLMYLGGGPTLQYLLDTRPSKGREVVGVLCPQMSSPIARGYSVKSGQTVKTVNGKPVSNFGEFVDLMRDSDGEWLVLEFNETGIERLVFRRAEVLESTERVMESNGIRQQASKDIRDRWTQKPK
jgi:S1-C subfamily serine protease